MKALLVILSLFTILLTGSFTQSSFGQADIFSGGVDHPGKWWVGEGLKKGDYFEYNVCHVDYRECADFELHLWMEGEITVGTEQKWLAQVVVYDRNKIVKGNMELGKIAPEPTGGSPELGPYRGAFKTSIVWLSAFATADIGVSGKGPKEFSLPSWGKIANIGGQQIIPTALETISVPAGTYDTVRIEWKTGGAISKVWVLDGFPFPIKGETWTHVSEGIPPPEYQFQLLDYKENVSQDPFQGIVSTEEKQATSGCPQIFELGSILKTTKDAKYLIDIKYGPKNLITGCDIKWIIKFKNKFDETAFLNQVHYDIWVLDNNGNKIRTISSEEGVNFLYSPSGQVETSFLVNEPPGTAHYAIFIYGLSPKHIVPSVEGWDVLQIDIPISDKGLVIPPTPEPTLEIPSWIKNNARWWADNQIDDNSFVQGIQYMIKEGIMKIPPTQTGTGTGSNQIPDWIRNNADWWAEGLISDKDFVQGIQYLIKEGIMRIA